MARWVGIWRRMRQWQSVMGALALLLLLMPGGTARAANPNWVAGIGNWDTAGNWSTGVVPTSADDAIVNNYGTAQIQSNDATALNLIVGNSVTGIGTGTGTVVQTGFTNTVDNNLTLGSQVGSSGTYELSNSGSLEVKGDLNVGYSGTGLFKQTGGTNTVDNNLYLGKIAPDLALGYPGGVGTYELSKTGNLEVKGDLIVGYQGTGTFNQTGGTNTVDNNLVIASQPGSTGTYNFLGGSLSAKTIQVNPGGTFMGTGTLSAGFTNNGLMKPGASPGTLNLIGSYTQGPTGNLEVEIASASNYDKLNISGAPGTASLDGTVSPLLLGSYIPKGNTALHIITTTEGVTGTFSNDGPWQLTPTLFLNTRYKPSSVDLVVLRDYTNPGLGLCPNQWQVGNMLNSVATSATGDLNHVLNVIDFLPNGPAVATAFNEISPEKYSALANLAFAGSVLQRRSLAQRITDLRFGTRELSTAGSFPGFFDGRYSRTDGLMMAYNIGSLAASVAYPKNTASDSRWGVYVDPDLVLGNQDSSAKETGYSFAIGGFTAGVDYRVADDFLVGLATGYNYTSANYKGSGGSVSANTWPLTAYAAYLPQDFYAYASLGYALNLFDVDRKIQFRGLSRTANSSPTGNQFNAYGEMGYDIKDFMVQPVVVTPAVSLSYASLSVDSFIESNAGALNLKVNSQTADSLQTGLGAKVAVPFKTGSVKVVPQVYGFYQHEFSNDSRGLDAHLTSASNSFSFQTNEPERNFAVLGANVTMFTRQNLSAYINYNAEVGRENSSTHYLGAGVRLGF
jgi:uncharacterized protein with beta-barrel porin domain